MIHLNNPTKIATLYLSNRNGMDMLRRGQILNMLSRAGIACDLKTVKLATYVMVDAENSGMATRLISNIK